MLEVDPQAQVSPGAIPEPGTNDLIIKFRAKTDAKLIRASYYVDGEGPYKFPPLDDAPSYGGVGGGPPTPSIILPFHIPPDRNETVIQVLHKVSNQNWAWYSSGPLQIQRKRKHSQAELPVGANVQEVVPVTEGGKLRMGFLAPFDATGRIAILSVTLKQMLKRGETLKSLMEETGLGSTALSGLLDGNVSSSPETVEKATGLARKFLNLG